MSTLEIRMFGTMSLERDGHPLNHVPSRRVRDLLSYLLLGRDSAHSREHLAGVFWGDLEISRARHSFNTALWRLRRLLEHEGRGSDYLHVDSRHVGFNVGSDFRLDVAEFEHRCDWAAQIENHSASKAADLYRQAVDLYRGDLLTDCYDDWCLVERERLRRLYLQALDNLLAFHSARGDLMQAIDLAARILKSDPLREEVHRDLIELYAAAGQPAAALRQYRLCETTLRRELGIEPMPETQALFRAAIEEREHAKSTVQISIDAADSELAIDSSQPVHLSDLLQMLNEAQVHFKRASFEINEATRLLGCVMSRVRRSATGNETYDSSEPAWTQMHDSLEQIMSIANQFQGIDLDASS